MYFQNNADDFNEILENTLINPKLQYKNQRYVINQDFSSSPQPRKIHLNVNNSQSNLNHRTPKIILSSDEDDEFVPQETCKNYYDNYYDLLISNQRNQGHFGRSKGIPFDLDAFSENSKLKSNRNNSSNQSSPKNKKKTEHTPPQHKVTSGRQSLRVLSNPHSNQNSNLNDSFIPSTFTKPEDHLSSPRVNIKRTKSLMQNNNHHDNNNFDNHGNHDNLQPLNLSNHSSTQLEFFKNIADGIIKQKDQIIEKQRQKIEEMERKMDEQNIVHFKSNSLFKEKQLCALEYQLNELRLSSQRDLGLKDQQLIKSNQISAEKEEAMECLKLKLDKQDLIIKQLNQQITLHNKYMSKLPSHDEHINNIEKIKKLNEIIENNNKEKIKLSENIEKFKKENKEFNDKLLIIKNNYNNIINDNKILQDDKKKLEQEVEQKVNLNEIKKIKSEAEVEKNKFLINIKILESNVTKLKKELEKEKEKSKEMERRMEEDEKVVLMLKRDLEEGVEKIQHLKQQVFKLSSQNEELKMEKEEFDFSSGEMDSKVKASLKVERSYKHLMNEFHICACDIENIVRFLLNKIHGKEADINDLLGVKVSSSKMPEFSIENIDGLKKWMKELRKEIDEVRGGLADLMAEDLGRRLTCSQQ